MRVGHLDLRGGIGTGALRPAPLVRPRLRRLRRRARPPSPARGEGRLHHDRRRWTATHAL